MKPRPPKSDGYPSLAEIEWHVEHGRTLRAQAFAETGRRIGAFLRSGLRRSGVAARASSGGEGRSGDVATALRSPLTAIRSFTEILIDNPDLAPAERSRFLRILLHEEQRLERAIDALASGRGLPAR